MELKKLEHKRGTDFELGGERYGVKHRLGRGVFSEAFLARGEDSAPITIKRIIRPDIIPAIIYAQRTMARCSEVLPKGMLPSFLSPAPRKNGDYFAVEYVEGGMIGRSNLGRLGTSQRILNLLKFTRQILGNLCVLDDHDLVHNDVKSSHIIISPDLSGANLIDLDYFSTRESHNPPEEDVLSLARACLHLLSPAISELREVRSAQLAVVNTNLENVYPVDVRNEVHQLLDFAIPIIRHYPLHKAKAVDAMKKLG